MIFVYLLALLVSLFSNPIFIALVIGTIVWAIVVRIIQASIKPEHMGVLVLIRVLVAITLFIAFIVVSIMALVVYSQPIAFM